MTTSKYLSTIKIRQIYKPEIKDQMKKVLFLATCIFYISTVKAQKDIEKLTEPIVNEGKKLYKSEMASWYGTDIFLEAYKIRENIGGYFSYVDQELTKCIFFSKTENPKVIGTITFDSTYSTNTAKTDVIEREFTDYENDLYNIRKTVHDLLTTDSLFKFYENSSLNLIPLIENGEKKVYILSGPKKNGLVIFGNDYLVTFDKNNKIKTKKKLHKNIIPIEYGKKLDDENVFATVHTHLDETGDFITATDICTLMLYEKFAKWDQHIVMSAKYVCIWDCKQDNLFTLTRKAWDKIYSHQKNDK